MARVLVGDEQALALAIPEEAVRLLPDAEGVVAKARLVQHLPAEVEEPAVPPPHDRSVGGRVGPAAQRQRLLEHVELGEDGHQDVLGGVEAAVRRVHRRHEVLVEPRVLGHRGGRVGGVQLVPAPRGEQDRVAQLDRSDARALVVREGKDVVGAVAPGPVRVVRLRGAAEGEGEGVAEGEGGAQCEVRW